jgi:uncharacterized protein DUF6790
MATHDATTIDAGSHRGSRKMAILPFIGVILFAVASIPLLHDSPADWQTQLLENGVVYLIGWAGIGAGISHILMGRKTSASIGWAPSPYETEVGFANLGMGIAGLMAANQEPAFWLGLIVVNSIFRVGCGIVHIRQMIREHNFAPNNTSILLINFGVPAFLVLGYMAWA